MSFEDEIERKFLVSSITPECEWPVTYTESIIVQVYLRGRSTTITERVRRRRYIEDVGARDEFTHNLKEPVSKGHFKEQEREITAEEYFQLRSREDFSLRPVRKARLVFDWEGYTWELDVFLEPENVTVLEVELPSLDAPITLPPFIHLEKEVTGEQGWSNYAMAGKKWERPA